MRKCVLLAATVVVAMPALAQSSHYVRGYVTKNGTYVAPHYQTNPDRSVLNNWSTVGNVNPYTGKPGTINPYGQSSYGTSNYNPYPYGSTRPNSGSSTQNSTNSDDADPQ